jgi:hypothetical protein
VERVSARQALILHMKETYFFFLRFKEKHIATTNLSVKQADSIAARGSCIFLGVLLRDSFGSCHAVKIEIKKYLMLYIVVWLVWCY